MRTPTVCCCREGFSNSNVTVTRNSKGVCRSGVYCKKAATPPKMAVFSRDIRKVSVYRPCHSSTSTILVVDDIAEEGAGGVYVSTNVRPCGRDEGRMEGDSHTSNSHSVAVGWLG